MRFVRADDYEGAELEQIIRNSEWLGHMIAQLTRARPLILDPGTPILLLPVARSCYSGEAIREPRWKSLVSGKAEPDVAACRARHRARPRASAIRYA